MHNGCYTDLEQVIRHHMNPVQGLRDYTASQLKMEVQRQVHRSAEVIAEVDMRPRNVVVLAPGTIPKTPSGKLRRAHSLALVG